MKRKILILIVFQALLLSCSSINHNRYESINTFLKTKITNNESIIIIKEKADLRNALRIFYGGDKTAEVQKNYRSSLFDQKSYDIMLETYSNDTIKKYWKPKDFSGFDFIFENRLGMWNTKFLDKYESKPGLVFSISDPVFYKNKKYVLFYFSRASTGDIEGLIHENKTIIMQKVKGQWQIVDEVSDYIYH